ncbi:MAG: hypothetical protein CMK32_12130 [Porticoccaceae bacterium]|nr:hypothetical protein [Porticoccaceae bacterium]
MPTKMNLSVVKGHYIKSAFIKELTKQLTRECPLKPRSNNTFFTTTVKELELIKILLTCST